jgi:hypothetical protein
MDTNAQLKPALQSSKGRSGPWGGSRLINAFSEQSDGDKAELYSIQAIPGLTLFSDINSLPVRGAHRMGTTLYAVVGTGLYSIAADGTETLLATVPGTNPVRMADNGTELAIQDGGTTGYVYSGGTLTTPANLPSVSDVCFIDSYFVWTIANSDQFIISGINDGLSYDPLDVATEEGSPDILTGIVNDHRELLLFGGLTSSTPSTAIWVDTGATDFPFERQGNAFLERGCIDRDSIVKLDNGTWFVGDDRIVYRLNGYTPERMSTHAVEKDLAKAAWFRAFTYSQEGHKFYILNTDLGTWACDVANSNAWAERQSFGLDYYRCGCAIVAYGKTYFGDNQTGKFYEPDLDVNDENGSPMPVTIELPPLGDGVNRKTLYALQFFMETGVGDLTTTDPQAILTYSKNGGRSWSNEMWRTLGAQGEYSTRAVWRPNVEFRQLQLRISLPEKVRRCVIGYHADER